MSKPEDSYVGGERLARFIAGECSDEERGQVQAWIDADPARAELLASLSAVWELTGRGDAAWEVDRAWQDFVARRSSRPAAGSAPREPMRVAAPRVAPRRTAAMWALRAAAVLAVLIGGAVVWNQFRGPSQATESIALREFTTGPAEQIEVSLTDGTRVLLAPRSRLRLAAGYGDDKRDVHFEGQGVFHVTGDAGRPFRVLASGVVTEVAGTSFGVRAYDADPEVTVALAEGSVSVRALEDEHGARALTLRPGQVARAAAGGAARLDAGAAIEPFLAWTDGQLVFEDSPLGDAIRDLGRWYDVDIRLADEILAQRRLTATFHDEPVEQVIDLIALSLNLRYDRDGRQIVLSNP